jgi:hypothetical protein
MGLVEETGRCFPKARFRPAATEQEIARAEAEFGVRLPPVLREMYLAFDGFREDLGNAAYLLPLTESDGAGSMVSTNQFLWREFGARFPRIGLDRFLFFGMSGGDEYLGIRISDWAEIVAYHHHMEDEYEVVGSDILQVYMNDRQFCEAALKQFPQKPPGTTK